MAFSSPTLKSFIDAERKYSEWEVEDMSVVRRPLPTMIEGVLRKFGNKTALAQHDKLFHLFLETTLVDPLTGERHVVRTERNETLGAKKIADSEKVAREIGEEELKINLAGRPPLTYGDMLDRARDLHAATRSSTNTKNFTTYALKDNNCQQFVKTIMMANGLWDSSEHAKFIDQKAETLVPNWGSKILNAITGIGEAVSNRFRSNKIAPATALARPKRNPRLRFHKYYTDTSANDTLTFQPHQPPTITTETTVHTNVADTP